jgi:hypothetical protein
MISVSKAHIPPQKKNPLVQFSASGFSDFIEKAG